MKSHLIPSLALGLFVCSFHAQGNLDLKNPKQRASYSIGADIGNTFKRQDLDLDAKALAAGLADAYSGKPALTEAEMKETLDDFRKNMMARMESKQKEAGDKNLKEG